MAADIVMLERVEHAADGGGIVELRLARPPVNALNRELLAELTAQVGLAAQGAAAPAGSGAPRAAALLISGAPRVFSAGLDVRAVVASTRADSVELFRALWHAQRTLATCPVPVIFAITGHCPAGGTVLALHADYRVMAQGDFRLGLNEVQVGLYPGPVIHGAFRRLVGGHAAQLLTRGSLMDPATALRVGLVDELCEPGDCVPRALAVAREFCALPREAMTRTRALARQDLVQLFGDPHNADALAAEFAELGADMFFAPATFARLKAMFGG